MSKKRLSNEPSVRGYAVTHPPGSAALPIEEGWDQLLFAARGTLTVGTRDGSWSVPPGRALWLPRGIPATITNRFQVAVRTLYFATDLDVPPPAAGMVTVTGFVRELLLHTVRRCPLEVTRPLDHALLTVLMDQLHQLPGEVLWLPDPATHPAIEAARQIRREPTTPLGTVARTVGASRRTLERAFLADTELTLGAWRRRARLLSSLDYLAEGLSVTATSAAVGYSTPSAFVTAFKAELGRTPGSYRPH